MRSIPKLIAENLFLKLLLTLHLHQYIHLLLAQALLNVSTVTNSVTTSENAYKRKRIKNLAKDTLIQDKKNLGLNM